MTYLDTHVVMWLYDAEIQKLSRGATDQIESGELLISPMVLIELGFLQEIGRIRPAPATVLDRLADSVDLRMCPTPFPEIAQHALDLSWTRDPFDRLIVGHAAAKRAPLVTKDSLIRRHYSRAVW